ncbi:hypothetical protein [Streptomyces rimosus]|uniref:hypothetical protein n=1 Tax=Streptomyces rimosus TaxID=1927 RepID=UPI0004CB8443|nr:hypothetical protein [Streptomyces rimosus]
MLGNEEHPNSVLAEIILSKKVGATHIRLAADLISVSAQLGAGMHGPVGLSLDQRADMAETVLELEDAYRHAWQEVNSAPTIEQRIPKLKNLEEALRNAIEGTLEIARRHRIEAERCRLDGDSDA